MNMPASTYGRDALEPRQYTTKAGKNMTTIRLAVDVTGHNAEDQETLWIDVLALRSGRPSGHKSKGDYQRQPDGEVPFDDEIVF
jgi:hypothetical protein